MLQQLHDAIPGTLCREERVFAPGTIELTLRNFVFLLDLTERLALAVLKVPQDLDLIVSSDPGAGHLRRQEDSIAARRIRQIGWRLSQKAAHLSCERLISITRRAIYASENHGAWSGCDWRCRRGLLPLRPRRAQGIKARRRRWN